MREFRHAFTLVELLVVIAVIGLLSAVAVVALSSTREKSRNTRRQADLVQISKALELYYNDNGAYPSTGGAFMGVCPNAGNVAPDSWIPGLVPNYMGSLPRDPNTNNVPSTLSGICGTDWSCYVYRSDGIDYKVISHCTVEGSWTSTHPFFDPARPTWAWAVFTQTPAGRAL